MGMSLSTSGAVTHISTLCVIQEKTRTFWISLNSYWATLIQLLSTSLSIRAVLGSVSTRPCHLENKQNSKFSPELRSKAEAQNETPPSSSQLSASSAPHLYGGQFCLLLASQPTT